MRISLKILITIFFINIGCSHKLDLSVVKFKRVLGKENSKTLSLLISEFENEFLKTNYPTLTTEKAYKKFITDIKNQNIENLKEISKKSKALFDKSKLKYAIYESPPDSVWIERDVVKSTFKNDLGNIDTLESILLQTKTFNIDYISKHKDSIIKLEYNSKNLKLFGQYFNALEKVKNSNKYITGYLEYKRASGGFMSPSIIANEMLENDLDYSNYIIKSIVLFEFVY